MSWRTGSKLFTEIFPVIQRNVSDREERIEFLGELLQLFVNNDMDPYDVEDIHPDIRAALRNIDIEISEPERYPEG